MDEEDASKGDEFTPRPYQSEILNISVKENTIVYLPTGAGKTFIAIMLINRLSHSIIAPNNKITVFLVNTVPLVEQHCASIRRHTDFDVGQFSGDQNVDFWTKDQWLVQIAKYQVIVLTAQILLDLLRHGYFSLEKVNLMIFDECHQAVNDQPMRQIMQLFENVNPEDAPRVLGLTATLLNGNCSIVKVREQVRTLETTFHSRVATVRNLEQIAGFSTNPQEDTVHFRPPQPCDVLSQALTMLKNLRGFIQDVKFPSLMTSSPNRMKPLQPQQQEKVSKALVKIITSLIEHCEMMGVFGGNKATLACNINIERIKRRTEDAFTDRILTVMGTTVTAIATMFETEMSNFSIREQIINFSSPQLLTLIDVLRGFSTNENLCAIIFVKQRFTAKVLYYVIRALSESVEQFSFIRSNFIVGFNAAPSERDTREAFYSAKINKKIVNSFRQNEINVLIASNVVEEGIDIPRCTLVVKFDRPMDYRSYIQSKGRARHGDSQYVIMVPNEERDKYVRSYSNFQEVEKILQEFLVGKTDLRSAPTQSEIKHELYEDYDLPPYYVGGPDSPHVAAVSAISLLNRYCQSLQGDTYAQLAPAWYLNEAPNNEGIVQYSVVIEMPIMCPLRDPIEGIPMYSKTAAKRAAALEVCKQLHQIEELSDRLLPKAESEDEEDFSYLFTHWVTEQDQDVTDSVVDKTKPKSKPGTKKFIRQHKVVVPEYISQPPAEPDTYYLHPIVLTPVKNENVNISVLEQMVYSHLGFGLLSSNPLPPICDFPIFVSAGGLSVHINVNHTKLTLSHSVLADLRRFNNFVFSDLLKILKEFLVYDNGNESGMLLVVPINKSEKKNVIDMSVAWDCAKLERIEEPSIQAKMDLNVTEEMYLRKIVCPWYRIHDSNCIALRVCEELSPLSPFPSNDFETYLEYYKVKYNCDIVNMNQPLLLVKGISKRLNCILPRSVTLHSATGSKRSKQAMYDGFEEHLVPELCILQCFPGELWYQATCVPTILHRVLYLLRAEQLRSSITAETGLGVMKLPENQTWDPLPVDSRILHQEEKKFQPVPQRNVTEVDGTALPAPRNQNIKPLTNKDYSAKMLERQYLWTDEEEPVDIDREIEKLTIVDIEYYEKFVSAKYQFEDLEKLSSGIRTVLKFPALTLEDKYEEKRIQMLEANRKNTDPELWTIFQCLMSTKATEIVNLERLETLGDSFLKFSVSFFLLSQYPNFGEGRLTNVKGKMIGNRNLLYCGLKKNLGGYMKVNEFAPMSDWLPPNYCVPKFIRDKIATGKLSPNKLFEFAVPQDEQISGELTKETKRDLEEVAKDLTQEQDEPEPVTSMIRFLGMQFVQDKTVSDCVEALLGAYLHSHGIPGGLALLDWFGIIPGHLNPRQLFNQALPSPVFDPRITEIEVLYHIPNYVKLEQHLGYTFKNRGYLLQALTHASYTANRLTDCYQRLEFLGDAVLDFLITCHIFEVSDKLTPGQLTDLRSALVNNVTFAGLVVRNGFHKHLKFFSTKLMDVIDIFVKFQEERDFVINEEALILAEDDPMYMAENVHVPKVLGDLFESLAGAVFLDSGMDLQETWRVFYKLMWHEIETFRRNVPKNPVRLLYENVGAAPSFETARIIENGVTVVTCYVMVNGKRHEVHGFGENKSHAKRAAAKLALRLIQCN